MFLTVTGWEVRIGGEGKRGGGGGIQGNTSEHKQQQTLVSPRRLFDITTLH